MAVNKHVLLRYKILNDCFRNPHRMYCIDDLVYECNRALELASYTVVSKRTIQEDIKNLQLSPYYVEFQEPSYYGHKKFYRYKDPSYTLPIIGITKKGKEAICETIEILNNYQGYPQYDWVRLCLMQIEQGNTLNVDSSYVSFQHNADMEGICHFQYLLGAIINKQPLEIEYETYKQCRNSNIVHPYHLKQYNNRWFLIGYTESIGKLSVYALDRILSLKQLLIDYRSTEIDFEEYFEDVIGVTIIDREIEDVLLKVSAKRYPYIATKPLHQTQTLLKELCTEEDNVVRLRVIINNELEAELLSFANDVEVLEPRWFRERIIAKVSALNKLYLNNEENLHG